jgi:hypothetical protein
MWINSTASLVLWDTSYQNCSSLEKTIVINIFMLPGNENST